MWVEGEQHWSTAGTNTNTEGCQPEESNSIQPRKPQRKMSFEYLTKLYLVLLFVENNPITQTL